ncbi:MAG TPA: hypothetical protein PLQ19_10735, partial [Aeromicrobium sp.]|nr:hypothetical protein [Aeromicrobium sp.]
PGQIINRELAQVVVVGASAAWIGLAPLLFLGARESTNGTLDPLVALTVLVCLSSAILFGYMLGLLGRSALWAPVSFAAVFFYLALAGTESYVGAVVLPFDLVPGQVITTRSVVYRFVIYCLIGLAAWHGARYLRATAKARPPVTLIVLALLAVGAAVAPIWRPIPLVAYETSPPKTCRTVHGILYCVHQENRAQLTPIIQASQTVLARYSPTRPPQLTAIYDTGLRGTVPQDPDTTFWTAIAPPPMQAPSESAATDLAFALTTTEACENGQNSSSAAQAQRFVTSWLSAGVDGQTATPDYDGGGSPLPELFGTMTKSQIHNWFAKNGERLRNCRVNAEDLPR